MRSAALFLIALVSLTIATDVVLDANYNQYASLADAMYNPKLCNTTLYLDGIFDMSFVHDRADLPCDSLVLRSYSPRRPAVLIGGDWRLEVNTLEMYDLVVDGMYREGTNFMAADATGRFVADHCEFNRMLSSPMLNRPIDLAWFRVTHCAFNECIHEPLTPAQVEKTLHQAVLSAYELRQGVSSLLGGITSGRFDSVYPEPVVIAE